MLDQLVSGEIGGRKKLFNAFMQVVFSRIRRSSSIVNAAYLHGKPPGSNYLNLLLFSHVRLCAAIWLDLDYNSCVLFI